MQELHESEYSTATIYNYLTVSAVRWVTGTTPAVAAAASAADPAGGDSSNCVIQEKNLRV